MEKLTKDEMKRVIGGVMEAGSRCVLYCCNNEGDCGPGTTLPGVNACTSNEDCQTQANSGSHISTCPSEWYVAALCKG